MNISRKPAGDAQGNLTDHSQMPATCRTIAFETFIIPASLSTGQTNDLGSTLELSRIGMAAARDLLRYSRCLHRMRSSGLRDQPRMAAIAMLVLLLAAFKLAQQLRHATLRAPSSSCQHTSQKTSSSSFLSGGNRACAALDSTCVFVVSTGRAGSTNAQDFLNQLPGVLIHGENNATMQYVQQLAERIAQSREHAQACPRQGRGAAMTRSAMQAAPSNYPVAAAGAAAHLSPLKQYYESLAADKKPSWFNAWPAGTEICIARSIFRQLYGSSSSSSVSGSSSSGMSNAATAPLQVVGFKEIRYKAWDGTGLQDYSSLERHLAFLAHMCTAPKFIFNMRRNTTATARSAWYKDMPLEEALEILGEGGSWLERYASAHPESAFMLWYEDMFDPAKNGTVARQLAEFVGVQLPAAGAGFSRFNLG